MPESQGMGGLRKLVIGLEVVGTQAAKKSLDDVEGGVKKLGRAAGTGAKKIDTLNTSFSDMSRHLRRAFFVVAAFGTIRALGRMVAGIARTNAEFQRHEAILHALLGSHQEAQQAFSWIQDFATNTPFSIDEVTEAFQRLRIAFGDLSDSEMEGYMQGLGNVAAVMGHSIGDLVYAIQRATAGQTRRLSNILGTMVESTGRGIKFTFGGENFEFSSDTRGGALRAVLGGMATELGGPGGVLGGGIERRMDTIGGQLGRFRQILQNVARDLGRAGLAGSLVGALHSFNAALGETGEKLETGTGANLLRTLGTLAAFPITSFSSVIRDITKFVEDNGSTVLNIVNGLVFLAGSAMFSQLILGLGGLLNLNNLFGLIPVLGLLGGTMKMLFFGGPFMALFLMLEDLQTFFEGGRSFIGTILDKMDSNNPLVKALSDLKELWEGAPGGRISKWLAVIRKGFVDTAVLAGRAMVEAAWNRFQEIRAGDASSARAGNTSAQYMNLARPIVARREQLAAIGESLPFWRRGPGSMYARAVSANEDDLESIAHLAPSHGAEVGATWWNPGTWSGFMPGMLQALGEQSDWQKGIGIGSALTISTLTGGGLLTVAGAGASAKLIFDAATVMSEAADSMREGSVNPLSIEIISDDGIDVDTNAGLYGAGKFRVDLGH